MLGCSACRFFVQFTKCLPELILIRTHKLSVLFAVQIEVELWNRADVESAANVLGLLDVDSTKDDLGVLITRCHVLVNGLEAHARRASWGPEVDDDCWLLFD